MKTKYLLINIVFIATMVLTSCSSTARVGALRSESQSVDLGDASSVRTEIDFGAGDLESDWRRGKAAGGRLQL